jgi:hypothetical protein
MSIDRELNTFYLFGLLRSVDTKPSIIRVKQHIDLFIMWSCAEITKANWEEIKEFFTTQQAVLTEPYTGPDAQALDKCIVSFCGRDAPDEELLLLRCQAFGIWSATKSLASTNLRHLH